MLTWEWTTKHATSVRQDWAGRFWYSFYEKGAIMADFCRRALAYITGQPLDDFRTQKTAELAIGDHKQAKVHALAAYKRAWADGEPYVRRYELNKARALLEQLGADIPNLPSYDPAKDEKLPWEDEVAAAIAKLRSERAAKEAKKRQEIG